MKLGRAARNQLNELIAGASPLKGDFFRSVALHYFHPDDVISGEGTRLNGGRFVPVGVKAVYASLDEQTALREVTTRKSALGGRNQINIGEYPRMTYVISVATRRNLDLAATLPLGLAKTVARCLRGPQRCATILPPPPANRGGGWPETVTTRRAVVAGAIRSMNSRKAPASPSRSSAGERSSHTFPRAARNAWSTCSRVWPIRGLQF